MHIINTNSRQRRQTLLRFGSYGVMGVLVLFATFVLVLTLKGYGFDRLSGDVIRNGLVLVESEPLEAEIFINGQSDKSQTPQRLPLPEGRYEISLEQTDYRTWKRTVDVKGSELLWLAYPLLIPEKIEVSPIAGLRDFGSYQITKQRDRMYSLAPNAQPHLITANLNDEIPIPISFALPQTLFAETPDVTKNVALTDVSNDGDSVMVEYSYGAGKDFILVTPKGNDKPVEATNITKLFNQPFERVWFGANNDQLLVQLNGNLHIVDIKAKTLSAPVLSKVKLVFRSQDNRLIASTVEDEQTIVYAIEDRAALPLVRSQQPLKDISIREYDNQTYLVVLRENNQMAIYRQPHTQTANVPQKIVSLHNASVIRFSPGGRFVATFSDNLAAVYDLELQKTYRYPVENGTRMNWVDDYRLAVYKESGKVGLIDFDGSNQQLINDGDSPYPAVLSGNNDYFVSVNKKDNQFVLQRALLVVAK